MTDFGEYKNRQRAEDRPAQVRLRLISTEVDVRFKVKRTIELLRSNEEVQIILKMRGREAAHSEDALKFIQEFLSEIVPEHARLLAGPKQNGSKFSCTITNFHTSNRDGQENA